MLVQSVHAAAWLHVGLLSCFRSMLLHHCVHHAFQGYHVAVDWEVLCTRACRVDGICRIGAGDQQQRAKNGNLHT